MRPLFKWSQATAIAVAVGALSLGLSLWQLTVPGFLQFYDSGVYLAATFHLVSGALPYRDFTFVQPPGLLLLLSPVGFFSRVFGTHDGFVLARVVGAVVTGLNVSLLAWLVRPRGRVAMLIAGLGLALMPVASSVSSGVKLEPYLILFVLLGLLVIFSTPADGEASNRRLVVGGILFGVAAAVKLWAFFPFIALAVCLMPRYRRRVVVFLSASAISFAAICLPFFLSAPSSFISQVFTEQLTRKANNTNNGGVIFRLKAMTGFQLTSLQPTDREVVIAFVALVVLVAVAFSRRIDRNLLDVFLLLASLVTVGALLVGPDTYTYYGYFTAPFLLGLVGVCVTRLGVPTRRLVNGIRAPRRLRRLGTEVLALGGAVLVVALIVEGTSFYSNYAYEYGYDGYPFSAITNLIPAGSCVVYDQVVYGVVSNRLSTDPNCPEPVDLGGMWMAWGDQLIAPSQTFAAQWQSYFEAAQYAVLSAPYNSTYVGIPWTPSLRAWFGRNYYLSFGQLDVFIYAKIS
ncbi:MAG TPA: hypothetical protein VII67_01650 [Acidimicrobiales bacterium]